jgi:putative hydrolase of the HAD superfamily
MSVEVILFDLGGVLVDFSGVPAVAPMLGVEASASEIRDRWSRCPHTAAFQRGELTTAEFGERFARAWGLVVTPEQFLQEFRTWSRALLPGAADLLALLRPRFRLAALSNSNELHWARNTTELGITGQFEVAISSHQVGLSKPDPRIYRAALDRLEVAPGAVLFFDDVQDNVEAAAALGIHGFRVDGVEGIRDRLITERLLEND